MLEAEMTLGVKPSMIHNHVITSRGATPDEPTISYNMTCEVDGLVSRAGTDLMVSVGKLLGSKTEIVGAERERNAHIYRRCPNQYQYIITLDIPEGYEVNQASLASASRNVSNDCGVFIAQTKIEGDKLVLMVVERYLRYVEPNDRWAQYLQLIDEVNAFKNTAIILSPSTEPAN